MSVRFILLFILMVAFACAQPLVKWGVTVIDATGKPAQPDFTVVIEQDRIVAVSPRKKAKIPPSAQIVNGRGKFLIPGLWDMHAHMTPRVSAALWEYPLFLANGIVGVRDMFGPPNANAWRAEHAASEKPSPAFISAVPS